MCVFAYLWYPYLSHTAESQPHESTVNSVSGTAASIGAGTTYQFHNGDGTVITDLETALGATFSLAPTATLGTNCVNIDATTVDLTSGLDCTTSGLSFELHPSIKGEETVLFQVCMCRECWEGTGREGGLREKQKAREYLGHERERVRGCVGECDKWGRLSVKKKPKTKTNTESKSILTIFD